MKMNGTPLPVMPQIEIRPATAGDFEAMYGHPPERTVYAFVGDAAGEIVGIGGVYLDPGGPIGFLNVTERAKPYKLTLLREAKRFMKEHAGPMPVRAIRDKNNKLAGRFLLALGFRYMRSTSEGELYEWNK